MMPDYSACQNEDCLKKEQCARFLMHPWGMRQSVAVKEGDGKDCNLFWDYKETPPFSMRRPNVQQTT